MSKVITLNIDGHYIAVSDRVLGATGASAATTLRIIFDASWSETSKRVYFTDARGVSPVSMLLTTTMLVQLDDASDEDAPEMYDVDVPAEVLSYPGTADITIQGVVDEDGDGVAEKVMQTVSAQFSVLDGSVPCGVAIKKPSVDEMLQIQGQIDKIKADIVRASAAADAVEDASEAAREAETHAATASQKAAEAAECAAGVSASAERAAAAKLAAVEAAADAADAVAAVEAAAGRAESAASQAASAAESAADEAMARLRELCVLKITFDGLFTPGSEYTVSCTDEHGSGEVKTLSVPESLQAVVYCHTETGYAVSCVDETGKIRAVMITTGRDFGEYEVTLVGSHRVPWETATPDNAAELFVMAMEEEDVLRNPQAWNEFTLETVNDKMRFRSSESGDFASAEAKSSYTGEDIEFDWRGDLDENMVLKKFTSLSTVRTSAGNIIRAIKSAAGGSIDEQTIQGNLQWEQMQYYLLHGELMPNMLPEYKSRYWWRTRDVRYTSMVSYTDADGAEHTRPTAATMDDLRTKLETYANASGTAKELAAEGLRVWLTQEAAVDLVLKRTERGGSITSSNLDSPYSIIVDDLLMLADAHKEADLEFSNITWSQVTYAILRGKYVSAKGAQAPWYTTTSAYYYRWKPNAWIESQCAFIFTLEELIAAVQNEDYSDIETYDDICRPNMWLRADNLFEGAGDVQSLMRGVKAAYEEAGGTWEMLAAIENIDSAWYLIQYYLYHGSLVTGGTNVLEDTATAGKQDYWWKDGWKGISTWRNFYDLVRGDVPARVDWLGTQGGWDSVTYMRDLRATSWEEVISAAKQLDVANLSQDNLWYNLQFLLIHKNATAEDATALAVNEGVYFYWWYNRGSGTATRFPATPDYGTADEIDEWSVSAISVVLEARLKWLATGNEEAATRTAVETIMKTLSPMRLRVPDDAVDYFEDTTEYTAEQFLDSIDALVKKTYLENISGEPEGYEKGIGWNYLTEDGIFTYNEAAYNAVMNLRLTRYQLQRWLETYDASTGSGYCEISDDLGRELYWWMVSYGSKNAEARIDRLKEIYLTIFSYGSLGRASEVLTRGLVTVEEWGDFGYTKDLEKTLSKMSETRANQFIGFGLYNWAQLEEFYVSALLARVKRVNQTTKWHPKSAMNKTFTITQEEFDAYIAGIPEVGEGGEG